MKQIEIWRLNSVIGIDRMALHSYWDDSASITGFALTDGIIQNLLADNRIGESGIWAVHVQDGICRWLRFYKIVESKIGSSSTDFVIDPDFSWPGNESTPSTRVTHWPPKQ